jgi:hypothetical protein
MGTDSVTQIAGVNHADVMRLRDVPLDGVCKLLGRFGLALEQVDDQLEIPGSYWGEDEAGLIANKLYARTDTPLHSILHEACHWITCSPERRETLHTDAADNQAEENATCYLQIILADELPGFGRLTALRDMDRWGYSFRLGSAQAWFEQDATEELRWLQQHGLLDTSGAPNFVVRSA